MAVTNVATFRQFYEDKDFWQPDDWHEGDCPIVGEELDQAHQVLQQIFNLDNLKEAA